MKRGAANSVGISKFASKYSGLLEDFLDLQKEYVSKKRKLQAEKQKLNILRDEVRFLRQRHTYLIKSYSAKAEAEPELGPRHNVDIAAGPIRKERNVVNEIYMAQNVNGREELAMKAPKPIVAKPIVAKPIVAKPIVGKPIVGKPIVAKPIVAKPIVGKPIVGKPIVAKPIVAKQPKKTSQNKKRNGKEKMSWPDKVAAWRASIPWGETKN